MGGQGEAQQLVTAARALLKSAALGLAAACAVAGPLAAADRATPSGLPVPRFVSIKKTPANARSGPGDDQRVLFVYNVRGVPLQVIAETTEWRRVCDPEGQTSWLHKRLIDAQRTVMNTAPQPAPLYSRPRPDARPNALLNARALATLVRCDKGWCKIRLDGASGWVREGALWGTSDTRQCR